MAVRRERLAERREALGFTQESFGREVGVELSTVGRWERGTQDPQPWMRPKIAKALQVSTAELAGLLASATPPPAGVDDVADAFSPEITDHVRRSQEEWLRV